MTAAAMPGTDRPRVVIVDDHGLFRSGVRSELGDQVDVAGEADDVATVVGLLSDVALDHPLVVAQLGPVVGTHTGPGTIGVCYQLRSGSPTDGR